MLRECAARDRPAVIELFASPEVGTYIGGPRPRDELEPVVLRTRTANDRAMRLAATLGFTEVERFEEYGAEQWLGVRLPVTSSG